MTQGQENCFYRAKSGPSTYRAAHSVCNPLAQGRQHRDGCGGDMHVCKTFTRILKQKIKFSESVGLNSQIAGILLQPLTL